MRLRRFLSKLLIMSLLDLPFKVVLECHGLLASTMYHDRHLHLEASLNLWSDRIGLPQTLRVDLEQFSPRRAHQVASARNLQQPGVRLRAHSLPLCTMTNICTWTHHFSLDWRVLAYPGWMWATLHSFRSVLATKWPPPATYSSKRMSLISLTSTMYDDKHLHLEALLNLGLGSYRPPWTPSGLRARLFARSCPPSAHQVPSTCNLQQPGEQLHL